MIFDFNFPISFKVSTVIETEVAENTEPTNAALSKFIVVKSRRKNKKYNPPHKISGTKTPAKT